MDSGGSPACASGVTTTQIHLAPIDPWRVKSSAPDNMTEKSKAVVLVSGGMDSCVTAAMARTSHQLAFLHAGYGQRTERRERAAFHALADFFGVRERLIVHLDHLKTIGGSALTDERVSVPEGEPDVPVSGESIPVTYVPFRDAHFLSVAVSWAEVIGPDAIFIGAVSEDSSGYPDCRAEYYRVFEQLANVGTRPETQISIVTPVIGMKKSTIV